MCIFAEYTNSTQKTDEINWNRGIYLMMLLLLLQIQCVLLHKGLQLRGTEYMLLQQLLHLMETARGAEHHLRGSLRWRCPWWATGWRTLRGIRRWTPLWGLRALMWTRLGPWCPRTGLLRLLRNDWLLLLGHGCCCHCVSSGTELPIALVLDAEILLLLLWISNATTTSSLYYVTSAGVTIASRRQTIPIAALAVPRWEDTVARLLLLLLQGCKQRSSLQYENKDRRLDQRLLRTALWKEVAMIFCCNALKWKSYNLNKPESEIDI